MNSFEEAAFNALSGNSSIPFADDDSPSCFSSSGKCSSEISSKELICPETLIQQEVRRGPGTFRTPLAKSSSLVSPLCGEERSEGRFNLSKSRTDGYVPRSMNPLQRYENALLKYQKSKVTVKERDREIVVGCGYHSSSEDSVARQKSKSTGSIDARSVNNILDQYEELDCGRSSELSDAESVEITDFEDVMRLRNVRRVAVAKEEVGTRKSATRMNQSTQIPGRPRPQQKDVPRIRQDDALIRTFGDGRVDPEVLLRKGEVQKRVDEWLTQTQGQNFRIAKDKTSLVRSNSSNCHRQRNEEERRRQGLGAETEEKNLNSALSCDELNNERRSLRVESSRLRASSSSGTTNDARNGGSTTRDPVREYSVAKKTKVTRQECGPVSSVVGRRPKGSSPASGSRIPQLGNAKSKSPDGRTVVAVSRNEASKSVEKISSWSTEGRAMGASKLNSSPTEGDRVGTRPVVATPTRRSSLKRTRTTPSNGQLVPSVAAAATTNNGRSTAASGARSPNIVGPVAASPEETTLPNKDRESRRPLLASNRIQTQLRVDGDDPAAAQSPTTPVAPIERIVIAETTTTKAVQRDQLGRNSKELCGGRGIGDRDESECKTHERDATSSGCLLATQQNHSMPKFANSSTSRQTEGIYGRLNIRIPDVSRSRVHNDSFDGSRRFPRGARGPLSVEDIPSARETATADDAPPVTKEVTGSIAARMKSFQGRCDPDPIVKPPAIPSKTQPVLQLQGVNGSSSYVKCRLMNPVSSFKPNNAMYATLRTDDDGQIGFASSIGNASVVRSHYATPKQISKTSERPIASLGGYPPSSTQTIHADDLEAIPRPQATSLPSPYGEKPAAKRCAKDGTSPVFDAAAVFGCPQEDVYAKVGDNRFYDPLETIVEDQRTEEVVQRRFGITRDSQPFGPPRNSQETIYATPRLPKLQDDQSMPKKTFTTFRSPSTSSTQAIIRSVTSTNAAKTAATRHVSREDESPQPRQLAEHLDANSLYESRRSGPTVPTHNGRGTAESPGTRHREDASTNHDASPLGNGSSYKVHGTPSHNSSRQGSPSGPSANESSFSHEVASSCEDTSSTKTGKPSIHGVVSAPHGPTTTGGDASTRSTASARGGVAAENRASANESTSTNDDYPVEKSLGEQADAKIEGDRRDAPVVNAILMMTLRFEQEVPSTPAPNSCLALNNFEARRVSQKDYSVSRAVNGPEGTEDKIYVTREEMEHERLMEMLRKGDFEAAKLELERSYTLSTPGGESPICCPPCSPPPAPTAYISSARASSRRLGVGGASSPERDPLGRLLRFLKTFYRELGTRDPPHLPAWAAPLPLGTLCPAHFQPHLQLVHKSEEEHRLENIKLDQIFAPVRLSDGTVSEAPRRVAVEGGPGSGRTTLCLRLLHQWATQMGTDGNGSPALAFIVPLRELRGSPLLGYLARELLPRTAALGDALAQVWRTLHLMEDRVLFVLDGYDECLGGRGSLGDAVDLLEGRLFPDARILVTCSPKNWSVLAPLVQRRINLAGLEWPHVERLCAAYFIHNDIAERVREFLEVLNSLAQPARQLGQHPLGWLMLCSLYQDSGSLPAETNVLVQAAVKCIVKRSLDPPVPYNEELPSHCRKRLEDFGRLSLAALREGRCCYTEAELRSKGGGLEVTRLGFLTRGLTFGQRRKPDLYTPIHASIAEFLAAYYMTSVAHYANILRRELEGLPSGIVGHLAGLLGPKTHLILNQLCPLEVPPRTVFSLLKAAGSSPGNVGAVCRLVGAGPGFGPAPNEPRAAPLVHTAPIELEGWARILESNACTLEALEIVFQVERGSDPRYFDDFFEALAGNESVRLVRITSLLGQEFPADEAQRLARHLRSVLGKKRLNDFELVITCLEESAHDRLECVVGALCRGLSLASQQLARLVLDMNLSGEQVSRVCEALKSCVQVQALHLPHLGCGREGLAAVAELLKQRPLLALNLAGSWGAKNEDPSSSGISMGSGSGSGSSGCASSTLGTLPLNRCYSSLPRGAPTVYGSLTRPATLPRLPLGLGPVPMPNDRDTGSKRNSDSVLCHRLPLLHPLPTCDLSGHQGTGFHEIFNAIREPTCKLRSLNVSKCLLGSLDAGCLGETVRTARHLDALRAAGASRPADMMPIVLALTEAPCLQLLDLASPRLALDDHPSRLLCHALARNSTLKLLSLEGWTFRIEESDSLTVFSELLRCTSVRELSLCNARLHLAVHEGPLSRLGRRDDAGAELLRAASPPACPAIVFLRLAGFQVTVNDRLALRGPLLLPFLAGFTALSELDLSLDKSTIGGSSGSLLFIDDKILCHFFSCLSSHFKNLQSLRINFWRVTLEDCDRTMRQISKYLKLCNLSFLKMNGLIVTDSVKKIQMEHSFLQSILTHLQFLTWLCLDGMDLSEAQATSIGKCIRDRFPGSSLKISAKDINVKSVKALVAAAEDGGRAEILYTGGSHCRLRITKMQKNGKHKKK